MSNNFYDLLSSSQEKPPKYHLPELPQLNPAKQGHECDIQRDRPRSNNNPNAFN